MMMVRMMGWQVWQITEQNPKLSNLHFLLYLELVSFTLTVAASQEAWAEGEDQHWEDDTAHT